MKRTITIAIVVLLALGLGYYLFTLSPQTGPSNTGVEDFDLSGVKQQSEPSPVTAEDHVLGNRDAKNTFIIYEDFQCPACATFAPIVKQVPAQFRDTKVVFRHYPLLQIHKNAPIASYAAEAAGAQGKFWEMTELLYANQEQWSVLESPMDKFAELAQQAGVADMEKFKNDTISKKFKQSVQDDLVESLSLGLQGTPSVIFNNAPLQLSNLEGLKQQAEKLYK